MRRFPLVRLTAAAVSAALLVTTPGVGAFEAAAQVVRSAPVGGSVVPLVPSAPLRAAPVTAPGHLAPSLTLPSAASLPTPALPTLAAPTAAPARAAAPSAVPARAAAQAVSVPAAAPTAAVAVDPAGVPLAALTPAAEAVRAVSAERSGRPAAGLAVALSSLFDGGRLRAALEAVVPSSSRRIPAAGLRQANAAREEEAASGERVPTPAPAPAAEAKRPYAASLALAGLGGAAAYFLIPTLLPMALALPFVSAVPVLALKAGLVVLGFGLGASLLETDLWRAYPREVVSGALDAGRTAFRFWARFGLVFRAVLTASSVDAAMKAELPAAFWKYPVLAWLPVLVGYVFAPVVTVLGAAFKAVETPARAAWRGTRRIVVGLLPFMADVFSFLARAVRAFIPAMGAFLYRGGRMAAMTAMSGAAALAAPVWNATVRGPYAMERAWDARLSQVPAALAMVLARALGLAASVFLGAVGGLLGFVVGLPLTVTEGLFGFASRVAPEGAVARADKRWQTALERAAELFAFHRVGAAVARRDAATLPRALARLAAGVPGAVYSVPFSVVGPLGLWAVGLAAALGFERAAPEAAPAPARRDEAPAKEEPVEEYKGSPWAPMALSLVGLAAGFLFAPVLLALVPMMWLPAVLMNAWALNLAGALVGAAAGLALSQPRAWLGLFPTAWGQAKASAGDSFRLWARLGLAARVSVTGKPVDPVLFEEAPAALTRYPLAAWPAVVLGYASAAVGAVVGGVAAAAGVPLKAAWKGLVVLLTAGLIRRLLRAVRKVLVHGIPFVLGFAVGGVVDLARSAFGAAAVAGLPVWRGVVLAGKENAYRTTGLTGLVLKRLVQAFGVVAGLAAALVGLAVGAVYLAPYWLAAGLEKGLDWADSEGRLYKWAVGFTREFERDMSDASGKRLALVVAGNPELESGLWQGVVRGVNALAWAASSVLWGLPVAVALAVRAARNAGRDADAPREEWTERPLSGESRPRPEGFLATVSREAGDGWANSLAFWTDAGRAFGYAVHRDEGSLLGKPAVVPGATLGAVSALTGALAGVVEVPGRAALAWAKRQLLKLMPFLRRVWDLAVRVAKRVFPFVGGLIGGAVTGVVGSAAFGALLLGRPWFKYVVSADYDTSSVGRFLGVAALRLVAGVAGVVFGVLGLAFGLLAALPYSLTTMVAFGFQWGGIGGKSELFFRHWTGGALAVEMKRLSKLTDSFDFSKEEGARELPPMDGWVRLGMVAAASFAAALAATVAGYVAYARSIRAATRAAKAGAEVPGWGSVGGDAVSDTAYKGSKVGRKAGGWLGQLAGLAGAAAIAFGFLSAPSWLGALGSGLGLVGLVLLAAPVGWLAGLLVGAVLGGLVGMLVWLDRVIKAAPDAAPSAKDDEGTPPAGTRRMGGGAVDIVPASMGALFMQVDPVAALAGAAAGLWLGGRGVQDPGAPFSWSGAALGAVIASLVSAGMWMMWSGGLGGLLLIGLATAIGLIRVSQLPLQK